VAHSLSSERCSEVDMAEAEEWELEEEEEPLNVWAAGDRARQQGFSHLPHDHVLPLQVNDKQHAHLFAPLIPPGMPARLPSQTTYEDSPPAVTKNQRVVSVSLPGKCQLEHTEDLLLLNNGSVVDYELGVPQEASEEE